MLVATPPTSYTTLLSTCLVCPPCRPLRRPANCLHRRCSLSWTRRSTRRLVSQSDAEQWQRAATRRTRTVGRPTGPATLPTPSRRPLIRPTRSAARQTLQHVNEHHPPARLHFHCHATALANDIDHHRRWHRSHSPPPWRSVTRQRRTGRRTRDRATGPATWTCRIRMRRGEGRQ